MPKNSCAVGCSDVYQKGSGIQLIFIVFQLIGLSYNKWIAVVNRQNWNPTRYTWICSEHFVSKERLCF